MTTHFFLINEQKGTAVVENCRNATFRAMLFGKDARKDDGVIDRGD